jgi:cysteine desulfurase
VPGIVGFGKAAEIAVNEMRVESERLSRLRDKLIKGLLESIPYAFLNGHPTNRLPDNAAVRFSFIEGESILLSLDMMGCSSLVRFCLHCKNFGTFPRTTCDWTET